MEVLNPDSFCPVEEQKTEKKILGDTSNITW